MKKILLVDDEPCIPVIMLSGISDEATVRKGLALGAVGYLNKTCSIRELLATAKSYSEK